MTTIPVSGQSYTQRSLDLNAQRCVNMIPVLDDQAGRSQISMVPTEGVVNLITAESGMSRGLHEANERLFAVMGDKLQEVNYNQSAESATLTERGTLLSATGKVWMANNGTQLMLVDDSGIGYIFTLATNTLTQITDPDFTGAGSLLYLDGYFIYHSPDTAQMYTTAILDGSSVNALDIATAETRPDNLVTVSTDKRQLFAFGKTSVEVWFNAANPTGFPFSRRPDGFMDVGCSAEGSVVNMENTIVWLDNRGRVVFANGLVPEVISTPPITREINRYSKVDDAIAFEYRNEGHSFYVLTFPSQKVTWVFDFTTGLWHERSSIHGGEDVQWRVNYHIRHETAHIVTEYFTNKILLLKSDLFDEDGKTVKRIRTTPHLNVENKFVPLSSMELAVEAGVGSSSGQGEDPQISLEISKDGGRTWGSKMYRKLGQTGEYGKRVKWNRLGVAREWTARFTVTDPVKFVMFDAYINEGNR